MIAFVIKSAICMVLFFGLYWLILRKEKLFSFNRFYLIVSILLSLTIPFISVPVIVGYEKAPAIESDLLPVRPEKAAQGIFEAMPEQATFSEENISPDQITQPVAVKTPNIDVKMILVIIYIAGLLFMLIRFCRNIVKVKMMFRMSEKLEREWYRIALIDDKISPFSFLRTIYLNKLDYNEKRVSINVLNHELEHIRQGHSFDIIFFEILHLFFWFNPALLLYKRAARINHEYLADEAVINKNTDTSTYANELINFISHRFTVPYTSGFSPSMIRLRLFMLNRPVPGKSTSTFRISAAAISLLILGLIPCMKPTYAQQQQKGDSTVGDADGNLYQTVMIGNKIFMAENLKTTKYNDGTEITLITDNKRWSEYKEGFCWYGNNPSNKEINGALYNWYAVNTGKLCPTGWHVPTKEELYSYLILNPEIRTLGFGGNPEKIGKSLASSTGWETDQIPGNVGNDQGNNNKSGFNLLPGGMRGQKGNFDYYDRLAILWSSTDENEFVGSSIQLSSDQAGIKPFWPSKRTGASVRCMKDYYGGLPQLNDTRSKTDGNKDIIIDEVYFNDPDFKPLRSLLVINGKKIQPDDVFSIKISDIKTIKVLKNRKATRKYGKNGKDGVFEITTYANDKKSVPDSAFFKPIYTINDTTPGEKITLAVSNLNSIKIWKYPLFPNQDLLKQWRLLEIMTRDYYIVDGKVVQKNGEPLEGVKVTIAGNPVETVTDANGHFLLKDVRSGSLVTLSSDSHKTLTFKAIGRVFKTNPEIVLQRNDEPDTDMILDGVGSELVDFSGTWKLNKDQSKTPFPDLSDVRYDIRQFGSDSLFLTSTIIISGTERKIITKFAFNTAKRNVYLDSNRSAVEKCKISPDGRSFFTIHKSSSLVMMPGAFTSEYKSADKFSLSNNGKQLIISEYRFNDPSSETGEELQVRVFDKE